MKKIENLPLFSVIIPAYQCGSLIDEAVQSVLCQSEEDFEVIIIDDCSLDNTWKKIQELADQDTRIRIYQNQKNLGVANTRNRGLDLAKGTYVAFLDGDDRWRPDKLEKQRRRMEKTACDVCYTSYSFIDSDGRQIRRPYLVPESFSREEFLKENYIGCSTAVIRAESLGKIRMRSEYTHEDYVFWLELLKNGAHFYGITEPLTEYRILKDSRSSNKYKAACGRWKIYRNFLGFGLMKSFWYQVHYILRGLRKHFF